MTSSDQVKWFAGIVVPLLLLVPGIMGFVTGETVFPADQGAGQTLDLYLTGKAGRIMALTFFCLAAVIHLHFFQKAKFPHAGWIDFLEKLLGTLSLCGLGYSFIHLFDIFVV